MNKELHFDGYLFVYGSFNVIMTIYLIPKKIYQNLRYSFLSEGTGIETLAATGSPKKGVPNIG